MLWKAEVKKILLVRKGLLLLAVCLLAKLLLLGVFPEMKDGRISLSQNQYNKYLRELYGESTPEKNAWVIGDYARCLETINQRETMEGKYARNEISEETYREYTENLNLAYLHRNAAQIFSEKAAQFEEQNENTTPAWYLYEYGWQTIFSLQQFPDIFLLLGLLLLAAQSFTSESAAGILPVLLSAKNGKSRLFFAKLLALLFVGLIAALVFGGAEVLVFHLRGWSNDARAPIYSVSLMAKCRLSLSLGAGYGAALLIRLYVSLLFSAVVYGLSVWLRNPINTMFAGMCLLLVPLLLGGNGLIFTHGGLLCGTRTLNALAPEAASAIVPLAVVTGYSCLVLFLSLQRHKKGL